MNLPLITKLLLRFGYHLIDGSTSTKYILRLRNLRRKNKLKELNFSLVANNCVAGTFYEDLKLTYLTPFVGLYILPGDFIKMCSALEEYLSLPLLDISSNEFNFPVARLGDISIFFMHYPDFESARDKWERRKARVNFSNTFFILVERDGCKLKDLKKFNSLPHEKKIMFTSKSHHEFDAAFQLKAFKNALEVGNILGFKDRYLGRRHMYDFDFVSWINNK